MGNICNAERHQRGGGAETGGAPVGGAGGQAVSEGGSAGGPAEPASPDPPPSVRPISQTAALPPRTLETETPAPPPEADALSQSRVELSKYDRDFPTYSESYFSPEEAAEAARLLAEAGPSRGSRAVKYTLYEKLGQGSSATVYHAFDENNRHDLAVKIVSFQGDDLRELEEEGELLSRLSHPNIVKCFGRRVFRREKKLEIYLEYVDGGSIRDLLNKHRRFSEEAASKWTAQVLRGLEYLHSHGVIHRDIKSLNTLVNKEGVAKLTDFGSAGSVGGILAHSVGTVAYMAPEVLAGGGYERWADVWSLGCLAFEMLTGDTPFRDKTAQATMLRVQRFQGPLEMPEGVSRRAAHFVRCCVRRDPRQRRNVKRLLKHPFILTSEFSFSSEESFVRNGPEPGRRPPPLSVQTPIGRSKPTTSSTGDNSAPSKSPSQRPQRQIQRTQLLPPQLVGRNPSKDLPGSQRLDLPGPRR